MRNKRGSLVSASLAVAVVAGITALPVASVTAAPAIAYADAGAAVAQGTCGPKDDVDAVTWAITQNDDGEDTYTLTLSGTGATASKPWNDKKNEYLTKITKVEIGEGVTSVVGDAFHWMTSVKSVSIPASLTSIGDNSFLDTDPNIKISVTEGNPSYKVSDEGILFSADGSTLIFCPTGLTGSYVIPSTVTALGSNAFNSSQLSSIDFSQATGMTEIAHQALSELKNAKEITLPANIKALSAYVFYKSANTLVHVESPELTINGLSFAVMKGADLTKVTDLKFGTKYSAHFQGGTPVYVDSEDVVKAIQDQDNTNYKTLYKHLLFANGGVVDADGNVTKNGFAFDGWFGAADLSGTAADLSTAPKGVYYAKWEHAVAEVNGTAYSSLDEAVKAANAADSSTFKLLANVTDHHSVTFNKKVDVTAAEGVTFNGTMRLSASESTVSGVHFIYDAETTHTASLVISTKTESVKVTGNTFEVQNGVKKQPNSVWIEGAAKNTVVSRNTFSLGGGDDVSVVGVALTAWGSTVMDGVKITNNTVTMTGKDVSGFNMFIKAYGARDTTKHEFGITNLTVSGNTFDNEQSAGVGNFLGLSNVNGLTYTGNTVKNTTYGVFNVTYRGTSDSNTGIVASGNTNVNVTYPLNMQYVNLKHDDGTITQGLTINDAAAKTEFTDVSKFREESGYKAPTGPTTMAFVGWYSDAELTTPLAADKTTGAAYAKFVPVSSLITFNGGALRKDVDASVATSLRFGYTVNVKDNGLTLDTTGRTGWSYSFTFNGKTISQSLFPRELKYVTNADGTVRTNLVIANIPTYAYDVDYTTTFTFGYTTADGTPVALKFAPQARNVLQVAKAIKADADESQENKDFADSVIDAASKAGIDVADEK